MFSADGQRILSWSDYTVRQWDVQWAMRDPADPDFVREVCKEKLGGASISLRVTSSVAETLVGARHIDVRDVVAAPILRGREGEDVCDPPPTARETMVKLLRAPVR